MGKFHPQAFLVTCSIPKFQGKNFRISTGETECSSHSELAGKGISQEVVKGVSTPGQVERNLLCPVPRFFLPSGLDCRIEPRPDSVLDGRNRP